MSKKPDFSSFTPSNLNRKAAKKLAEVDKIISKTSDTDKQKLIEQGLSLKPMKKAVIRTVKIKKIVTSAFFIRSKTNDSFDDLDTITELDPIKVAVTEEAGLYVLIDGERRLDHAKSNGEKKIEAQIIGTVVCQSQIGMARGKEMAKFKKPLTPLELAYGLMQLKDQIILDFGEDAFFSHGGDRKTNHKNKQSLPGYIAEVLGIKQTAVDTLLRFGSNVGPIGLAGLLSKDDMVDVPLREIHHLNKGLKNINAIKKIENCLVPLIDAGAAYDDLIKAAGDQAFAEIITARAQAATEDNDNNDNDDNVGSIATDDLPPETSSHASEDSPKSSTNDGDKGSIKNKAVVTPSEMTQIIEDLRSELKHLGRGLEIHGFQADVNDIYSDIFENLQNLWGKFCHKVVDAGLR